MDGKYNISPSTHAWDVAQILAHHSTAQHSTAQHSTAHNSTAQHSTAQNSTAQHSTAQNRTALLTCMHITYSVMTVMLTQCKENVRHTAVSE